MLASENIFRFNDPTVQNLMPVSNVSLNEAKLQKSPSTIITHVQKSPNLGTRAATLPRNSYNQICSVEIDNNDSNLIQIETSSAFVRKSPTPKLRTTKNTANLDELSDLFAYADEQNVEANHNIAPVHNKGSNISIGQLSNVCSSGYQSITTQSQSSSPTDIKQANMALAFENPVYHMDFQNKNTSSSDENLQIHTPSPVMRRNLRIPRTNPGLSYRLSDDKRIDKHRYEIDKTIKDLSNVGADTDYKFKRSLDRINGYEKIGIPLQHSHSNNALYYSNNNLNNKRLPYYDYNMCTHGYNENMNPDSAYQTDVHSGSLQKKLSRRPIETDSSSESEIQSRSECSQRSTRTVEQCEMEIARLQRTIDRLQAKLQRSGKNGHQQYTVSDDNKMKSIIARSVYLFILFI